MSIHVLSPTKQHLFESTNRILIFIEAAGTPQIGQTPSLYIRRVSDGFFFNGASFINTAGVPTALSMLEIGTMAPGIYSFILIDPGPIVPVSPTPQLVKDEYEIRFVNLTETMFDVREFSRELRDINTQGS